MSSNSIFSSVESEKRWLLEVYKNFHAEYIMDIDLDKATCVLRVPKSLSETKPEAYAPQHLGLGPYQHVRPELYVMQKKKLSAIRRFLGEEKLQNFTKVVEALVQWECAIRACYDQHLDFDIATLATILAVDALYLLQLLNTPEIKEFIGDIMMLENQIPMILLEKTLDVLQSVDQQFIDIQLSREFRILCRDYSPLEVNQQSQVVMDMNQLHLLHQMYYLIVTNRGINDMIVPLTDSLTIVTASGTAVSSSRPSEGVQFLAWAMQGAEFAEQILSSIEKVPWDRIVALFKKGSPADEETPSVEEIDIPTVSRMSEDAGIKFKRTTGGIRDIKYDDNRGVKKVFSLPKIRVDANTEVILRNLVAYEAATAEPGSILELADYIDLMCGIIDTPKDVDILRKEGIVESELPDEEIARIFNGIGKSTKKTKEKSDVQVAIDSVNESYHNARSVKVKEFLKKYGYACWKILSMLITIVVLVLIILKAFCSVFGCGRWFGKETTTQIHNLLFLDQ